MSGLRRRDGQADAAQVLGGQAGLELRPGGAAVGRFVDGALRAAVDQRPDVPAALVGGGEQHVGVARIEDDVGDAGVLADGQHLLPGLAAVGGLVQAAVAARPPERSLGGDVDDVGVARVDDDLADVLGLLQAHVLPDLAAVVGAVDAVAVADAALAVVLAGADPDDVRVLRDRGRRADRIRAFVVEDRRPGGAGVGGLPDAARGDGDVDSGCGSCGWTAKPTTRPEVTAGPSERRVSPLNVALVIGSSAERMKDEGRRMKEGEQGGKTRAQEG